jgi:hypothetical protein
VARSELMNHRVTSAPALSLAFLALGLAAQPAPAQDRGQLPPGVTLDPDAAQLAVGDLRRMAEVVRALEAGPLQDTAAFITERYLAHASPGLRAYVERYDLTGPQIAAAIARRPSAYAQLDALADALLEQADEYRSAFRRLQQLFPEAAFPTVWFVAGHYGAGGIARPEGAIVAVEQFSADPDRILPVALHEVAHFQQAMVQGSETYQSIYGPGTTLLALALREGSAELIAELTTGRMVNEAAAEFGIHRERELWSRFRDEMLGSQTGDWMFVRPGDPAWPQDLGYWIGYRIARSYYDAAADKRVAIRDILALTDFEGFLRASGYAPGTGK